MLFLAFRFRVIYTYGNPEACGFIPHQTQPSTICSIPSSTHQPTKFFISPIYSRDRCRHYLETLLIFTKSGYVLQWVTDEM